MKTAARAKPANMPERRAVQERELPEHLLDALASLAESATGVQPSALDRRLLRGSVCRRMEALGVDDAAQYVSRCVESTEEQVALLEGVLNGETSFFRDAAVFAEMLRWCLARLAQNDAPLRILSAPCSTVEEAYSIAAMLLEAGAAPERFSIDALDFSPAAIAAARAGLYQPFALRSLASERQQELFEPARDGLRVRAALRGQVCFRVANLLEADVLRPRAYDLICCRNLLLYMQPQARLRIAVVLAEALRVDGRIVLGSADWGRDLEAWFALERPMQSLAVSLRQEGALEAGLPAPARRAPAVKSLFEKATLRVNQAQQDGHAKSARASEVVSKARRSHPDGDDVIEEVNALHRGALEAHRQNDVHLAEQLCRQALYLDNDHLPSIELLAKLHRPYVPPRLHLALHERLKRHRAKAPERRGGSAR